MSNIRAHKCPVTFRNDATAEITYPRAGLCRRVKAGSIYGISADIASQDRRAKATAQGPHEIHCHQPRWRRAAGRGHVLGIAEQGPAVNRADGKDPRHTITETVIANGKIYPVLQVHISPEVSGEITASAGQGRPVRSQGRSAAEDQPGRLYRRHEPGLRRVRIVAGGENDRRGQPGKSRGGLRRATRNCFDRKLLSESDFDRVQGGPGRGQGPARKRHRPGERGPGRRWTTPWIC